MTAPIPEVSEVLDWTTRDLHPSPDLLDRVRHRGRRRLVRRRAVLAAALVVVVAGSTAGALQLPTTGDVDVMVASPLLTGPTRGDLAEDRGYLDQVRTAWQKQPLVDALGEPHVVWAGTTPAGRLAVVAQATEAREVSSDGDVTDALFGFVEPTPQGPTVRTMWGLNRGQEQRLPRAVLLGADLDTLVVLDIDLPTEYSIDFRYEDDGRVSREYQPLAFVNGAAVLRVPAQRDRFTLAFRSVTQDDKRTSFSYANHPGGTRSSPDDLSRRLPGADRAWSTDLVRRVAEQADWTAEMMEPYEDWGADHGPQTTPRWDIHGVTPDGRRLLVYTHQFGGDRPRIFGLIGRADAKPRVVYGGFVDPAAPLPIRLRLPDRQGVVVAAEGARLRYRTGTGDWLRVAGDATLLPAAAAEVEVSLPGRAPVRAPLH